MKGYIKVRNEALDILNTGLPDNLYYHSIHHTFDVLKVCEAYIQRMNLDEDPARLLRLGALLHDIGFTATYKNHEERGTKIANALMSRHGLSPEAIKTVNDLIMATRIPQSPSNELERIICDADLDYLGRNDFYEISNLLFRELKERDRVNNQYEWDKMQIQFLEAHTYHTPFAREHRQPVKEQRIAELKQTVATQNNPC